MTLSSPLLAMDDWSFVLDNAGYMLREGLITTVFLTLLSLLLGFLAGFPAGIIEVYGGRYSRALVTSAGVVLRGTPILVIMILMYFGVGISSAFVAAIISLGIRSAAYQSQIFRGSLQSITEDQMEAARAVGLTKRQAIRHVIVPQAVRRSIPGMQNELTIVLKDTSIAFAIGLGELLRVSYDLFVQQTTAVLEVILFVSLLYFIMTFTTNRALDLVQRRITIPDGESA